MWAQLPLGQWAARKGTAFSCAGGNMMMMRRQLLMTALAIVMLGLSFAILRYRFPGTNFGQWGFVFIAAMVISVVVVFVIGFVGAAASGIQADLHAACQSQMTNRCQKCNYDLTGNVSGVCPECGTSIEQ
jgi:hypothetical protein